MTTNLDELKKIIIKENINLLEKKLNSKNINLQKEDFNELLIFSCEQNKQDVINLFYKDNRFDFSYQETLKCGYVKSAFNLACFYSSYDVVCLFLERNVVVFLCKEDLLTSAACNMLDDPRVLKKILQMSREQKINLNYNYVLRDQASTPHFESIKELFKDDRVNPLTDKNEFLLTFLLLYDGSAINTRTEIFEFILNDPRFSFIPYNLQDFKNAYKKIKKDQYILYKLLFSIPELKDDLLFYLNDCLDIFPENKHYLDFINTINKINKF